MPFKKKTYRKKKPYRKKNYRRKSIIPRGLRQALIPLTREITTFINTKNALPTGWVYGTAAGYNTLQHQDIFTMDKLPGVAEFAPIFKAYKLNCVMVSIQSLHNSSMYTSNSLNNYYGGNLLCYAQQARSGTPLDSAITQSYWDQIPAKKTFTLRGMKVHHIKVYPKVLSTTYISALSATTVQRQPGWFATSVAGLSVPHYGLNFQFSYIDPGLTFNTAVIPVSTAPISFKITYKYLFQIRGIH